MNGPPVTSDPLLVPTPFTLHFPREYRDRHSWCSESDHPPPASTDEEHAAPSPNSIHTYTSTDVVSTRNVENAVIATARQAWRRSVRQVSLPLSPSRTQPRSAPAQLLGFGNTQPTGPRKILQSQLQLAAEIDREREEQERARTQTTGLAVPPSHARSRSEVVAHEPDDISVYSQDDGPGPSPGSAVFGSDILRLASGRRRDRGGIGQPSPAPTQTSFMLSPYDSRRSTYRYSYNSTRTTGRSSDESVSDDTGRPSPVSRASKSRSFLSPTDSFVKSPWRVLNRYSFASMRSRSREELPTVREASPGPSLVTSGPTVVGQVPNRRSKRTTFGQASFSQKRANRSSLRNAFPSPYEPAPPVPALLPTPRTVSPFPNMLAVEPLPTVHVSPATPEPTSVIAPPPSASVMYSPGWLSRPIRSSGVRGPRPLPTASITTQGVGSGWPRMSQEDYSRDRQDGRERPSPSSAGTRSRRNSCPTSLHSSKSLSRDAEDVRRPSI